MAEYFDAAPRRIVLDEEGRPSIEMAAQGSTSVGYVGKFSTNRITIDTFGGAHKPARADQAVCAQLAAPLRYG